MAGKKSDNQKSGDGKTDFKEGFDTGRSGGVIGTGDIPNTRQVGRGKKPETPEPEE